MPGSKKLPFHFVFLHSAYIRFPLTEKRTNDKSLIKQFCTYFEILYVQMKKRKLIGQHKMCVSLVDINERVV